ncbi:rhombosortase [Pseudoxanthomonas sangjuensis]|uniref:rhombosortase n=1 Tax=Pseudoxanthomonas sangjuensis TaxID=1503750 RepID=UPI001391B9FC|nr:rhombosortase [Pseudoxanthomonas sangjuensis]
MFDLWVLDRADLRAGQAWRLWTGHLAHTDARHALVNLAACALLVVVAVRMGMLRGLLLASLAMMPAIGACLFLFAPWLQWYAGLSGLLHGWAAWLLRRRGGAIAIAGLLLLVAKLAWEAWWRPRTGGGIPVAIEAHRFGALAGLLFAMIGPGKRNRRKRADPQQPRD